MTSVYQNLIGIRQSGRAGYFILLDPDKKTPEDLGRTAAACQSGGADAILVGGSLMLSDSFDRAVKEIKRSVEIPVILFPGGAVQLSAHADAVFFMSLISGRNPQALIGEQVYAAPIVRALSIEPISMGYMLIESGGMTAAEFMSNTRPIPRDKPEIAVAHALAAEYLGMKMVYLEGGSGAKQTVPEAMIRAVASTVSIPVIVGGGISEPAEAASKVKAGASFVVTGNVMEKTENHSRIREFADAVHSAAGVKA